MKSEEISRRSFLKRALALSAVSAIPSFWTPAHGRVLPTSPLISANDRVNIAFIGIGQRGGEIAKELYNTGLCNVVALCDVDMGAPHTQEIINMFPKAARFQDFRTMFDRMADKIDAVSVGVPDHSHFPITIEAMAHGKHVYVEKPMARTFQEIEIMMRGAKKYGVVTQMGNQGNSFDWCRQIAEWIQSGVIGDVYEVHCWTDRPIWPQGLMKPNDTPKCPKTLDWDLWIGPAQKRPYNPVYTPWNWRGWWDFGTGALGDMACHIMDPLYWALDLKYPTSVIGSSTLSNLYSPPHAQIVTYTFPARPPKGNVKMPEVKVYWYDGLMPPRPEELKDGQMMGDENGGIIFIGTKGKIMTGCYGMNPTLLPVSDMEHFNQPKPTIPRVKGGNGDIWSTNAHEQDWIRACKESPENRTEASSNFQFSGPFNEMVVMGVLAVRLSGLQGLHRELQWDGENMRFTNISPNDKIKIVTVDDFKVIDGDPRFDRRFAEFNAAEMANEWIKHTYNNGFSLPDMPR